MQLAPGTAVGACPPFLPPCTVALCADAVLVLVVNNHRVLHGRSAFTGRRRMCGAYIGGDEYRSRLAVLREKFAGEDPAALSAAVLPPKERSVWSPLL